MAERATKRGSGWRCGELEKEAVLDREKRFLEKLEGEPAAVPAGTDIGPRLSWAEIQAAASLRGRGVCEQC